jgi:hypothetical protein
MSTEKTEILDNKLNGNKRAKKEVQFITIKEWKKLKREREIKEFKNFSASLKLPKLLPEILPEIHDDDDDDLYKHVDCLAIGQALLLDN